jgi:adenine-specific DNA-methyltransferase
VTHPPYNTGSAFEHFDDGLEHSLWLSMMRDRVELLWRLLSPVNGTLLVSINDDEGHYLKVLCDEVCSRTCFVASLVWNYEGNTDNQARIINYHEYILVYSKTGEVDEPGVIDPSIGQHSKLYREEIRNTIVKNGPKNPPRKVVIPIGFPAAFSEGVVAVSSVRFPKYSRDIVVKNRHIRNEVVAETGWSSRELLEAFMANQFKPVLDSKGQETRFELTSSGAIEAVKRREQRKGHFLSVLRGFGTTNQMRLMLEKLGVTFTYPKPVDLIAYLVEAFTGPDDWVLDSFAGSGTTGHAILKLNKEKGGRRRFILVELNQATVDEVIIPRLKAVIDGHANADLAKHGGGFRYYHLAPSLLEKDKWGNWVINKAYNPAMLAQAVCKLEGFTYSPSDAVYWQQGHSTEQDFIYVTTQNLSHDQLQVLSDEVGDGRSVLVMCSAFRGKPDKYSNLTIKKIPKTVLTRCEWGHDDYSLKIENLPKAPIPPGQQDLELEGP